MNYYIDTSTGEYYYDFPFLQGISRWSSITLQYILDREGIGRIRHNGEYLYRLKDLYDSKLLSQYVKANLIEIDVYPSSDNEFITRHDL